MDIKTTYIENYLKLKEINGNKKPLKKQFLEFSKISELHLTKAFGKDAYSKLQQACGDDPNKLNLERTSIEHILDQYGQLIKIHQRIPSSSDWVGADFYPRLDGLRKVHNLNWAGLQAKFLEAYSNKIEWKEEINLLKTSFKSTPTNKADKTFSEILEKLNDWRPDRKRIIEEGYKIELRNYLDKYFNIEEEVGESNPDLLIQKKYPIEVKKDPTQSEYDRLLGQMIRHNKLYGNAIAVVTSISSEDRFKKFQTLFTEVHKKLGMTAELFSK